MQKKLYTFTYEPVIRTDGPPSNNCSATCVELGLAARSYTVELARYFLTQQVAFYFAGKTQEQIEGILEEHRISYHVNILADGEEVVTIRG